MGYCSKATGWNVNDRLQMQQKVTTDVSDAEQRVERQRSQRKRPRTGNSECILFAELLHVHTHTGMG